MKVTDFEAAGWLSLSLVCLGVDGGEVSEADSDSEEEASEESVGVGGWREIFGLVRPSVEGG